MLTGGAMELSDDAQIVEIEYTNYRGDTSVRRILPLRLWFGSTEWHPSPQWHLDASDLDKDATRSFVLSQIHSWRAVSEFV
jgi:predicted DNA-binding transcriptional regulator YafY